MTQALLELLARSLAAQPMRSSETTDGDRVALDWCPDPVAPAAPVRCALVSSQGAVFWAHRYPCPLSGASAYLARCQDWRVDPFPKLTLARRQRDGVVR